MNYASRRKEIAQLVKVKSDHKQNVFIQTQQTFALFKKVLIETEDYLRAEIPRHHRHIPIKYHDRGEFEAELRIAGDILVFSLHTNVFYFDRDHGLWKTNYIKQDDTRAYCGVINIYNFLSDSVKYGRENDIGYLVARVFVNYDNHYFIEGKREVGPQYNEFSESVISENAVKSMIESAILYCVHFDLLSPPYDDVKEVSVDQLFQEINNTKVKTGKRLGFKFQADFMNDVE